MMGNSFLRKKILLNKRELKTGEQNLLGKQFVLKDHA